MLINWGSQEHQIGARNPRPLNNTTDKNIKLDALTGGKLIVFRHLQDKACTLKKIVPVSLKWNLEVVRPLLIVHEHCKGALFR